MSKQHGLSLIELLAFIIIVGITLSGATIALRTSLSQAASPQKILQASQLANARLTLILAARKNNYEFKDPCLNTRLAACKPLETFAKTHRFKVSSSIRPEDLSHKLVQVTVQGDATVTLSMRVARYEQ